MTNKQIIIDRVDVSEWTDEEIYYKFEKHSPKAIRQIAFDLYKQLKHKEQECEELESDLTDLSKIIDCKNGTILTFKEQLDQLKAENEKLKHDNGYEVGALEKTIDNLVAENGKLKQTLTEIKEIAKIEYPKSLFNETFVEVINHCPYFDCGNCKCLENKEKQNCGGFICSRKQSVYYQENTIYFKQILQKISEVENEQRTKRTINGKNRVRHQKRYDCTRRKGGKMSGFDKKNGFECELCGARIGGEPYDFYQSLALSKEAGWVSRKDKEGNWFKFCCKEHADTWWAIEQDRVI